METAILARRLVPEAIRVRATEQTIILSDGRWSAEVQADGIAGLPEDEAIAALRPSIDQAIAMLHAAQHGDEGQQGAA